MTWRGYVIIIEVIVGLLIMAAALYLVLDARSTTTKEVSVVPVATSTESVVTPSTKPAEATVIGNSVQGNPIHVHTFGTGTKHVLLVGGTHGGYEWNSVLLAYEMIDYFTNTPDVIPVDVQVSIIPVLNPDGLAVVTGTTGRFALENVTNWNSDGRGRFNANGVDLNRNFDCNWSDTSSWRGTIVNTGTGPFSEPEASALREYIEANNPTAAVFWHSIAGNVYASECNEGVLPVTLDIMNAYATAGSYGAVPVFDAYPITGDVEGWLASLGIPAITVELETRDSIEWNRNLAGTKAILNYFSN